MKIIIIDCAAPDAQEQCDALAAKLREQNPIDDWNAVRNAYTAEYPLPLPHPIKPMMLDGEPVEIHLLNTPPLPKLPPPEEW